MKRLWFSALAVASLYALPSHALLLTPASPGMIEGFDAGPGNCEPECVEDALGDVVGLELLYKADGQEDGSAEEEGSFGASYETTFSASPGDPSAALIEYVGGAIIDCPVCYLAIKDGQQDPNYYFYDLAGWDGTEDLQLTGFWPQLGAISHVSIWGLERVSVPEPATLGLLGAGLLLFGLKGKRRSSKRNA